MTDGNPDTLAFKSAVEFFHDNVTKKKLNYFELLGISTTATHREIETAYNKYSAEFSPQKVAALTDMGLKKKAQFLVDLGKRAYEVLTDFEKRGQYEKMGYQDVDPESLKEVEPTDKAREIYRKAKQLYNQKNYPLAIKAMDEAIAFDPAKPDYYHLLGLCQSQIPEFKRRAEGNLRKAMEMEPWNAEHLVAMGMLFYSERLFKRAESYFRMALEKENNHALAKKKLAEIVGPEVSAMDKVQDQLGKFLPSIFGRKKKK